MTVYAPKDYTFDGSAGSLGGSMKLTKAGAGALTISGNHNYTGKTVVWDGALLVNGNLQGSPVTVWGGTWGGAMAAGKTGGRVGGTGQFSQSVTIKYCGTVTPGAGMNSPGTITFGGGLALEDGSTLALDLSDDPTGTGKTNDLINITGNLTLAGANHIVINRLNTNLPQGTVYPLINYSGSLIGSLTNFDISGITGIPVALTNAPGQIALVVKSFRAPAAISWTGGQGGNAWDLLVTTNWLNGGVKDTFAPNDTVRFDDTGASNLTVNLSGNLNCANVVVDSTANYTFTGSGDIIGAASVTKTNSGTLTINTVNNTFTGKTIISGGTLVVSELDAIGFPSPLGNPPGGSTNLVLSGSATLRATGESYTDRGMTLNTGTNSIDVFNSSNQLTMAGVITGSGGLLKAGGGTLALNAINTFTGPTIIKAGGISFGGGSTVNQYALGQGPGGNGNTTVTLDSGTLTMFSDTGSYDTCYWNIFVPTNSTGTVNGDDRCNLYGTLTGGGTFNFNVYYTRCELDGNWSAFTGQINFGTDSGGGDFRIGSTAGYANASINLAAGISAYHVSGTGVAIGALSGSIGSSLNGTPWTVGAKNTDATFAGNITGNSITKVGTGTWTLTGTNTYSGATTVNAGTLLVNNPNVSGTGSGAVTVAAAGTLGGNGIVSGTATINGRLSPGNSIGTLTFSNSLTLAASSSTLMEISKSPFTNDLVKVQATLICGGALIVTNVGGGMLAKGDSFKLFNATTCAGSFSSYVLPALGSDLAWDTSVLNTSGILSIIVQSNAVPPAAPGGLVATTVSASQINLTWTDNSTNESSFLIERSLDSTNFSQVLSVGAGVTNAADTALSANTIYYYRVRASNSAGNSACSGVASATTLPLPPGLVWRGDGTTNAWDVGVSANWVAGGGSVAFYNGANVIFDDTGSNNVAVTLTGSLQPASIMVSAAKNYTLGGGGSLAGASALVKTGSGQLTLSTTNNTFSGGIIVSNGTLLAGSIAANSTAWGIGPITFMGGTLQFYGYGTTTSMGGCTNTLNVPAGQTGTMLLPGRWGYSAPFTSPLIGGGTLNVTVDYIRDYFSGDWSAFTGQINVSPRGSTGDFRIDNTRGYANAAIYLNNGVNLYNINNNNLTIDLGELGGAIGASIAAGNSSSTNPTWRIGAKNTTSTYAGIIADSGVTSLIKVGTGTLILTGTNTYSGLTTISGGTLQIGSDGTTGTPGTNNIINNATLAFNRADAISDSGVISGAGGLAQIGDGTLTLSKSHTYSGATAIQSGTLALAGTGSIANSTNINIFREALLDVSGHTSGGLMLASGQTLSGNGAVNGNLTVGSGAKLAPGNSIGALTFSNSLTLSAGSTTRMEISKAPLANDTVNVFGILHPGGVLVVTNISGLALAAGDSFPLFNAGAIEGLFSSLAFPALGTNLVWDTNSFLVSGTLTVISTAPPAFNSVATLGDGNFRLNVFGPSGQDYELRATTNLMLTPVTLWDLVGSGTFGNDPVVFDDLSATNSPQKFFRLILP